MLLFEVICTGISKKKNSCLHRIWFVPLILSLSLLLLDTEDQMSCLTIRFALIIANLVFRFCLLWMRQKRENDAWCQKRLVHKDCKSRTISFLFAAGCIFLTIRRERERESSELVAPLPFWTPRIKCRTTTLPCHFLYITTSRAIDSAANGPILLAYIMPSPIHSFIYPLK